MVKLDGKVAIITGGASGMGEATVRRFAEEGARVVIADLQDAKGHTLADTLGGAAVYQHADVAEEADIQAAVRRAIDEFGRLDCMFNNAGFGGAIGPIESTPIEDYDRTMNVLLRGVFLGMKHAAPIMKAQASGSIISTASVAGLGGGRGLHMYSAAKAGVINLTRSVALEPRWHRDAAAGQGTRRRRRGSRPRRAGTVAVPADQTQRHARGHRIGRALARQRRRVIRHRPGDRRRWRAHGRPAVVADAPRSCTYRPIDW